MSTKENISHLLIDVRTEQYKILKTRAALCGKTLEQLILDAVDEITEQELWLFDPANKELTEQIKQSATNKDIVPWSSIKHKFE